MNNFISCKDAFPILADKTNKERYIDFLSKDDYKKFTKLALNKANYELTDKDLQLCEIICDMAIRKRMLKLDVRQYYLDHLLIAAMLKNTYKDDEHPVTSLFKPREELKILIYEKYEDPTLIQESFFEQVCQLIEAQYGEFTPVEFCMPSIGSMQATFAECVYIQECLDKYDN